MKPLHPMQLNGLAFCLVHRRLQDQILRDTDFSLLAFNTGNYNWTLGAQEIKKTNTEIHIYIEEDVIVRGGSIVLYNVHHSLLYDGSS